MSHPLYWSNVGDIYVKISSGQRNLVSVWVPSKAFPAKAEKMLENGIPQSEELTMLILLFELGLLRDKVVETFGLLVVFAPAPRAKALRGRSRFNAFAIGYPEFASAAASLDKDMLGIKALNTREINPLQV